MVFGLEKILIKKLTASGVSEADQQAAIDRIAENLNTSNRRCLCKYSRILCICSFVLALLSYIEVMRLENIREMLYFGAAGGLVFYLLPLVYKDISGRKLGALIHAFTAFCFIFAILFDTIAYPEQNAAIFIAFILVIPILFIEDPRRMDALIFTGLAAFCLVSFNAKTEDVFAVDAVNALIALMISIPLIGSVMRSQAEKLVYQYRMEMLSEMDILTGVHNRNSYEGFIEMYPSLCKNTLACIYMDVNGLHELNNTLGHEAGDKMLKFVASQTKAEFGDRNTYRIGGDEFAAFAMDISEEHLKECIGNLNKAIENAGYHVSIGYIIKEPADITGMEAFVKCAESRMYEAKRVFYEESGSDRRRAR